MVTDIVHSQSVELPQFDMAGKTLKAQSFVVKYMAWRTLPSMSVGG
jgi:hypothetical protein